MELSNYTQKQCLLICLGWLYALQGMPYGLQDKFIPMQLYSQNLSFTNVALMKILFLPWVCKGIWAPFIQVYFGPIFWLIVSVAGLGVTSMAGSFMVPINIYGIVVVLFFLNLLSAVQDIVVDGFALNLIPDEYLGFANSLQVVMYKIGSLFGGAGLIYLTNYTNWSTSFISLAILYFVTVFLLLIWQFVFNKIRANTNENCDQVNSKKLDRHSDSCNRNKLSDVFSILGEVVNTGGMVQLVLYVILYKMGERGAINNFPLYLLDRGVTSTDLAFWNGIVSQCMSIAGSIIGGLNLISNNKNKNHSLKLFIVHRSLCILGFYIVISSWHSQSSAMVHFVFYYMSMFGLCYLNFVSGIISTATFTLMMAKSRTLSKGSQATHYSYLASLEVAGKLLFATSAGFIIDLFSINFSFILFAFLSLSPYFLL